MHVYIVWEAPDYEPSLEGPEVYTKPEPIIEKHKEEFKGLADENLTEMFIGETREFFAKDGSAYSLYVKYSTTDPE